MDEEKVYLTRDESSNRIWVWRKISKKESPIKSKNCDMVMYQRENRSLENTNSYLVKDFKKKFGFIVPQKKKQCVKLSKKLLDNEDYKLISNNPDRKK